MKQLLIPVFALSLITHPVAAQAPAPEPEKGIDLMEEGAKLLLRGLLSEIEPSIDEFQSLAEEFGPRMQMLGQEMGPALAELFEKVDDFTHYQPPEIMPNGDIIIRRRDDAPIYQPETAPDIEL